MSIKHGGIAQLARAIGSYPIGHRFKSDFRYQSAFARAKAFPGPLVKRLRHGPFTAVTWVRFPYGSPKQTYPNYFVTNKVFGFVFYMNLEAENA